MIGARALGLNGKFISIFFLVLLSVATSITVPVVGALLMFVLLTVPASAARYLTNKVGLAISILFALIGTWAGITLSYYTSLPTTFFIATIEALFYFCSLGYYNLKRK